MDDYRQQALLAIETLRERIHELEQGAREPIAIVGYAARFPGAPTAEAFWKLLEQGRDAVTEIPADRWDVDAFYDADPDVPGKMVTRRAGFIEDIAGFDASFFGISPREATFMDPQHRLMLEVSWHALEHAGMPPADLKGSRTGIWMGLNTHEYLGLLIGNMTYESIDIYSATGTSPAAGVGRINYRLGLEGPAVIIDTACSSSLVAIHQATQALRSGECDMALAGGVNVILSPVPMINFSKVRMLSPDGRCKTFDAAADGYVRGEGCGAIVMKRLSDAVRDGDQVRAIIRGSAVNQDGASGGLTVPNGRAQQRVIADALKSAGLEPRDIDYLEAHGTGTSLGDPIEVQAAAAALGVDRERPLMIGSGKTNIGHLEAAAGIAGVIKVVMSLEHELMPKHLNFQTPSPHMPWAKLPVEVVREGTSWKAGDRPRIAGVSSFGFSGTNAHVIIEEAPAVAPAAEPAADARRYAVVPLSARTPEALKTLASEYVRQIESAAGLTLPDLAYTAGAGRSHLEHRAAFVVDSLGRTRRLLDAFAEDQPSAGAFTGVATEAPKTAWMFTGQGSQYAGMAKDLYENQPIFRDVLDHCHELLKGELELPLLDVIFGEQEGISNTAYAQPALFAIEMALARLWQHWGLEPDVVLGHSVGQYAAACVAGVFSLDDGLKLLAKRGKLMGALPAGGSMAAVFADAPTVEAQVAQYPEVSIAAYNGAHIVISGPGADVSSLVEAFQSRDVRCEALDTSHAFHSALLEPMLDEFEQYAGVFTFQPLQRTLVCNRTGKVLTSQSQLDASYWRRQARQPVQFAESVKTLSELGCKVLLEVGPQPVLTAMAMRAWPEDTATPKAVASLRKDQPDSRQMMEALAQLYVAGARPNFAAVDGHMSRRKIDLPRYPFEHKPYWFTPTRVDSYAMNASTVAGPPIPALNGAWTGETEEPEQTFV
ncbi:MAG: type I polyketide synthase, partial [Dehalococcoidia bacterium]